MATETRVPEVEVRKELPKFKCPEQRWSDFVQERVTVEGPVLHVKGTEIPLRVVAAGLMAHFRDGLPGASVNSLGEWLQKKEGRVFQKQRTVDAACGYVQENWRLTPSQAWGVVLFIRRYSALVEQDVEREKKFYTGLVSG